MTNIEQQKYNNALNYAADLCSRSEKCVFDIKQKLSSKDLSEQEINDIISQLVSQNFIDEQRYAVYYVNDKLKFQKWGKIKLRAMLKTKQISDTNIENALKQINNKKYIEILTQIVANKSKTIKETDKYKRSAKIIRHAASKGFENDVIINVLTQQK